MEADADRGKDKNGTKNKESMKADAKKHMGTTSKKSKIFKKYAYFDTLEPKNLTQKDNHSENRVQNTIAFS